MAEYGYGMGFDHHGYPPPTQKQVQKSLEASKQKVYQVWGNVINILEELENRKPGGQSLHKSETDYYDHSSKDDDTVDEIVQGQLIAMQAILKSSDEKIKPEISQKLSKETKNWMEYRRDQGLKVDIVDQYANMLLEILQTGTTSHNNDFLKAKSVNYTHDRSDVQSIIDSTQKAAEVDKVFAANPGRKAQIPRIRSANEDVSQQSMMEFQFTDPREHNTTRTEVPLQQNTTRIEEHGTQLIHISGLKNRMLGVTNNKQVVVYSGNKWKLVKLTNFGEDFVQIYEIPGCDKALALDDTGTIWVSVDRHLLQWTKSSTKAAVLQVIVNENQILILDQHHSLWAMKGKDLSLFKGFSLDNQIGHLAFSGKNSIWGLDKYGKISYYFKKDKRWFVDDSQPQTSRFTKVYGNPSKTIELWAVNEKNDVFLGTSPKNENEMNWKKDTGPRIHCLALMQNQAVALDTNYDIWIRSLPVGNQFYGHWERLGSFTELPLA